MFQSIEALLYEFTGLRFVAALPRITLILGCIFLALRFLPGGRVIAARFLQAIPTFFILITGTFFMLRFTPGGPFSAEKAVTPEVKRNLEAHYGLDKPLAQQYDKYLWDITPKKFSLSKLWVNGAVDLNEAFGMDFGPSFKYPNRTINEIIAQKLPVSIELGLLALCVAIPLGLVSGIIAALKPNTLLDYIPSGLAMIGICLPTFVLGPLLVLLLPLGYLQHLMPSAMYSFLTEYGLIPQFPASGWGNWSSVSSFQDFMDLAYSRALPAFTLGMVYAAYFSRLTRAGMREILTQDFIRTARAKGASEWRVIMRHALKGGLLPVVSFMGPALAGIISGAFVIEKVFNIPGLGSAFVESASNRDYTLVMGTVILFAGLIMGFNFAADMVAAWLNPKMRA